MLNKFNTKYLNNMITLYQINLDTLKIQHKNFNKDYF